MTQAPTQNRKAKELIKLWCILMAVLLIVFLIVLLVLYVGVPSFYKSEMGDGTIKSRAVLNRELVTGIELIRNDQYGKVAESAMITDSETINEILSCFKPEIHVVFHTYDPMSYGGCAGVHWNNAFDMKLLGDDIQSLMRFGDCDYIPKSISNEFIDWSDEPLGKYNYYMLASAGFCLAHYDENRLCTIIGDYIDTHIIN